MSRRGKNHEWDIYDPRTNNTSWDKVPIALLMDIRDELQTLNRLLGCHNFLRLPGILDNIERNTEKRKRVRKANP